MYTLLQILKLKAWTFKIRNEMIKWLTMLKTLTGDKKHYMIKQKIWIWMKEVEVEHDGSWEV